MPNFFDQFDSNQPSTNYFDQFDSQKEEPQQESRGITGAVADLGRSFAGGANSLMELGGTLYGLATGDMENFARDQGARGREYWNERKTPYLKSLEAGRKAKVDAAEGEWAKLGVSAWETLSSPSLLASYTFEQLPNLIFAGGSGRIAGETAKGVAKIFGKEATEKTVQKAAVGGAVGTGGAMQGSDVGGQAYDQLLGLSDEVWLANPMVQERINGNMDLLPRVKKEIARELSADAAIASGIVSVGINSIPMFRILESRIAGVKGGGASRLANVGKGFVGESLSEGLEEGSGAFAANVATQQIDPNQSLTEGVGEATGLGLMAGPMGGVAGFTQDTGVADVSRKIFEAPTVDDAIAEAEQSLNQMAGVDFEAQTVPRQDAANNDTIPGMDIPIVEFDETGIPYFVGPNREQGADIPGVDFRTRRDDEIDQAYQLRMQQEQSARERDYSLAFEQKADQEIAAAEQQVSEIESSEQAAAQAQEAADREGPSNPAMGNALLGAYLKDAPQSAQEAKQPRPAADVLASLDNLAVPTSKRAVTMPSGNPFPNERVAKSSLSYRNNPGAKIVPAQSGKGVVIEISERKDQEWDQFSPETQTLGIPRAEMPQIKAEHRGAMVNFLKGRFISSEKVGVPANSLKPTQAEFSKGKVKKALEYEGGDRSILISSDGYVVDGHHQWLANLDGDVQAIRIDAPIQEILDVIKEFPSATTGEGATDGKTSYSTQLINFAKSAKSLAEVRQYARKEFGPRAIKNLEQAITGAWNIRNQNERKRVKEDDSLAVAVAKLGGLNPDNKGDATGDDTINKMVPGIGPVFRKGGTSADDMALKLWEEGYLTQAQIDDKDGVEALFEALGQELGGGKKKYKLDSTKGLEEEMAAQDALYEQQLEQEQYERERNYAEIAQEHGQEAADLARLYDDAYDLAIDEAADNAQIYEQQTQELENVRQDAAEDESSNPPTTESSEPVRADSREAPSEPREAGGAQETTPREDAGPVAQPTPTKAVSSEAVSVSGFDEKAAIEKHNLPSNAAFIQGVGFNKNKYRAETNGAKGFGFHESFDDAAKDLRQVIDDSAQAEADSAANKKLASDMATQIKAGENPSNAQWAKLLNIPISLIERGYVYQKDISSFLRENFDVPANNIAASIGAASGVVTSDLGAETKIVYLNRLSQVFGPANTPAQSELAQAAQAMRELTETIKAQSGNPQSQVPKRAASYGQKNKLVTSDRAEELRQKLRDKLKNQLNSGVDPEMIALGAELAVYHIEAGARQFSEFVKAMSGDLGMSAYDLKKYLRSWYNGARDLMEDSDIDVSGMDTAEQVREQLGAISGENSNAERPARDSTRAGAKNEQSFAQKDIFSEGRGDVGQNADVARQEADGQQRDGGSVGSRGASSNRERSRTTVGAEKARLEKSAARDTNDSGSLPDSTGGLFDERKSGQPASQVTRQAASSDRRIDPAAFKSVKSGDLSQVKAQMPFLTEGQAEDVVFAENRLSKEDGFGVLFTNGTGTGKTFSGLGIIKRMAESGKTNILIAVPKQTIADAWIKAGAKFFDLDVTRLESTKDAGKGIVVTTYANLADNDAVIDREWDAIVADEAHYLSAAQDGKHTGALGRIRAMSLRSNTARDRVYAMNSEKAKEMSDLYATAKSYRTSDDQRYWAMAAGVEAKADAIHKTLDDLTQKEKERIASVANKDKPRGIFLSATPFSYEKSITWANEFLFDWGSNDDGYAYNSGGNFEKFMMQHFGYRMRYNKLTAPDAKVDSGLMQRAFNSWLKKEGALSGRALDSDFDYDRKFIAAESAVGRRVDDAIEWMRELSSGDNEVPGMSELYELLIGENFDYHARMYFLEAIKAREAVPYIKKNLELGRKVLVMHDFKKGGVVNPFRITPTDEIRDAYAMFKDEFSDLINAFQSIPSPIQLLSSEFPRAMIYNGSVSAKKRVAMQDEFNSDEPGAPMLMIAQGDAMREGVSIHDASGKHPRVLLHLGMPVKPTASIQQEGRIFRTGQASDAMFRYFTIGSSWERHAFASKIASRASAAENLAMGEQARGLKEAFINAYEEADLYEPGFDGEGKGGKETDQAYAQALTPWDMAKSYYFGSKKQGIGRSARGREHSEFFATPEPLGMKMVQWADIQGGESVLEPSAGNGAIARWLPDNVDKRAIEYTNELSSRLALHFDGDLITGDFMDHHVVNKYDAIVMNPPFGRGGKEAADHVRKAMTHLRDGGRIVALVPTGPAADKQFDKLLYEDDAAKDIYLAAEIALPSVTFERAGTSVSTRVLVLEKQTDREAARKIQQVNRDYSNADTIEEFFDRIEDSEISSRQKAAEPEPVKQADPEAGGVETWSANHTKTGAELFMAKPKQRMEREEYQRVASIAKQNGGYWSRFGKAGFLFDSEESRASFVAAITPKDPLFSLMDSALIAPANQPGTRVETVQNAIAQAVEKLKAQMDVRVVGNVTDLPMRIQRQIPRGARVKGVYFEGAVFLIADNLKNGREAQVTLAHELVGHKGVIEMLSADNWQDLRSNIDSMIRAGSKSANSIGDEVSRRYGKEKNDVWYYEFMAVAAERRQKDGPIARLMRKLREYIRAALKAIGLKGPFSESDIDIILSASEAYLSSRTADTFTGRATAMASQDEFDQTISEFSARMEEKYGLDSFYAYESRGRITLSMFEVPAGDRRQGVGSKVMNDFVGYADARGKDIVLSPGLRDDRHGTTSRSRLVKFYKQFGFVENKGRNKDFTISEGMVRRAKEDASKFMLNDNEQSEFDLNQQSEADITSMEDKRKADQKAALDRKNRDLADEQAGDFVLTGSNSEADKAAARGQGSLFSAAKNPEGSYVSWGVTTDPVFDEDGNESESDEYALIEKIFVPEESRRDGAGRRMLRDTLREIQSDYPGMSIKIAAYPFGENKIDMTDLVEFYESEGFDIENTDSHAVIMEFDGRIRGENSSASNGKAGQKAAARGQKSLFSAATQTNTPAFRKWFGDSKVVDENGEPLVVYHGTSYTNIEQFLPGGAGERSKAMLDFFRNRVGENKPIGYMNFRSGTFFSPKPEYAGNYTSENTGVMYPVYIKAENPVYIDHGANKVWMIDEKRTPDAMILMDGDEINEIAVMDPLQIKSAIGNNGNFDPSNPSILFSMEPTMDGATDGTLPVEESEFAAENRRLREQDKTLWDKAKKVLRRQFAPGGLLPGSVFQDKIARDGKLGVVEVTVQGLVRELEKSVRLEFGVQIRDLSNEDMKILADGLAGKMPANIKPRTKTALVAMRQYIDQLSDQYIDILKEQMNQLTVNLDQGELALLEGFMAAGQVFATEDTPAAKGAATRERNRIMEEARAQATQIWGDGKRMQQSLGKVAQIAERASLMQKIMSNQGEYVHRSYKVFDDPSWYKKIPTEVYDDAMNYLIDRYTEDGYMSEAEARNNAERVIDDIIKNDTAYDDMEAFVKESKLGAKDLSVLKTRKDIAPEIRALMGEHIDPRINFAKSATKMGRLIFNQKFLDSVKSNGMGVFLFTEENRPTGTVQIAGDASDAYSPLNGLWTYRDVNTAFKDALAKEQMATWYRMIVQFNGMVKGGKTVLSPTTSARNFQSAMFFALANGHFDLTQAKKSMSLFRKFDNPEKLAYVKKMRELGVIYDNPYAEEMMDLLRESRADSMFSNNKTVEAIRAAGDIARDIYSFGDDFWKVIGFENEKAKLLKYTDMTEAQAEAEAADRVRNLYPTYSMVGKAVQWLRRFPLAGTFVSFPAEIIRTTFNMAKTVKKDWNTPGMRPIAIQRAIGMSMVAGFAYAAQEIAKAAMGFDDDDEEAIRLQAAPWQKNSNIVVTGRDDEGNLQYFDISFLDPYNYFKRPITAIMRDQPFEDALLSSARDMLSPFFGTDIAAGALMEIYANKKESGGNVYKEADAPADQLLDIAQHFVSAVQPGFVSNLQRTYKAMEGELSPSGKKYDMGDEGLAWIGWRASTLDPKAALYYRTFDFSDAKADASKTLREVLNDPNSVTQSDIISAMERSEKIRTKAYDQMITLVQASKRSGMSNPEITKVLRASNVSQRDIGSLINGRIPTYQPSSQSEAGAVKRAEALIGREKAMEIRERYRAARSLN